MDQNWLNISICNLGESQTVRAARLPGKTSPTSIPMSMIIATTEPVSIALDPRASFSESDLKARPLKKSTRDDG